MLTILILMSSLLITISTAVSSFDPQAIVRGFTYSILFFFSNVFYPHSLIRRYFPEPLDI